MFRIRILGNSRGGLLSSRPRADKQSVGLPSWIVKQVMRLAVILACVSVAACFNRAPLAPTPTALPNEMPLLSPASFKRSVSAIQQITVMRGTENSRTFRAIVNISPSLVEVAALGPFNRPILSLNWDGVNLQADAVPQLTEAGVSPRRLLNDIQLLMWPCDAWAEQFAHSVLWQCNSQRRVLIERGLPIVTINYPKSGYWLFQHHRDGYQLEIVSSEQ